MGTTVRIIPGTDPTLACVSSASTAAESARVVSATGVTLYQLTVVNTAGVAQFVQIYDRATTPGAGAAPAFTQHLAANSTLTVSFGDYGMGLNTGLAVGNSTTAATRTAGASDCLFYPLYK